MTDDRCKRQWWTRDPSNACCLLHAIAHGLFLDETRKLQCAKAPFIRLIQRLQLILGIRDPYASTF
jgi:hypothetical protein